MSPRTRQQFEEIREEKRALIMDTALKHFADEGFHKTTINHLAKHAGISKGLMYNYFESKEELLAELIARSVREIYQDFDPDRDGFLSAGEFEHFIRKVAQLIRDKRTIWMLFFQMLLQKEVRDVISAEIRQPGGRKDRKELRDDLSFILHIEGMIKDYFIRKRPALQSDADALAEMNMFLITLKGLFITLIYSDTYDDSLFNSIIEKIVELYR
jgi:AcrR family transcriptional regulator